MIVAGQVIEPGEKRRIPIPVGEGLSLETVCFCGRRPGRTLVVTSGVHGCEYVGGGDTDTSERRAGPGGNERFPDSFAAGQPGRVL